MTELGYVFMSIRYEVNKNIEEAAEDIIKGEYINGQALGTVSRLRYGLCRMRYNGCEAIAVYNALVYLQRPAMLSVVAVSLESFKLFFGIFGCNPWRIGKFLIRHDVYYTRTGDISDPGAYIMSFWTGKRFFPHIHTIFCTVEEGRVTAYNRYNKVPEPVVYGSTEELLKGKRLITAYRLEENTL